MSKKRTSAESNNDEQTNEGSESLEDNAKRARLNLLSDTTLQDLPIELLECILVKVVAMEVKGLMLAKSVWKEKADLVISRLTTVCSHWSFILTTISFRTKLHRILDGTAQEIRLQFVKEYPTQSGTRALTMLKDETFQLYRQNDRDYIANGYYNHNNVKELQDLPIELLECILVKAVAMEVKGLKLAKSVWKEKADLVISRLRTVCSQWSIILTTTSFRTKLHRILDGTAQEIRLTFVEEYPPIQSGTRAVTTLKDETFLLYRQNNRDCIMNAYYNYNNVVEAIKDVVPLIDTEMVCMAACNVSNCVYVGLRNKKSLCFSVLTISKAVEHQFNLSIKYHRLPISTMSVSANGSLIILSVQQGQDPNVVSIYDANGSFQHEIMLSSDNDAFRFKNVIQRSNGNLVLAYVNNQNHKIKLLEIDVCGSVVRQYQSSFGEESLVSVADIYGRILIAGSNEGMELLDSEFNLLGTYSLQQDKDKNLLLNDLHYDSEWNEIMRIHYDLNTQISGATTFRFTEK